MTNIDSSPPGSDMGLAPRMTGCVCREQIQTAWDEIRMPASSSFSESMTGALEGGSPCCLSNLRNVNVHYSCHLAMSPVAPMMLSRRMSNLGNRLVHGMSLSFLAMSLSTLCRKLISRNDHVAVSSLCVKSPMADKRSFGVTDTEGAGR